MITQAQLDAKNLHGNATCAGARRKRELALGAVVIAALVGVAPRAWAGPPTSTNGAADARPAVSAPDVAELVSKVSPSVVNITTTEEVRTAEGKSDPFEYFFGKRPRSGRDDVVKRHGLGSGFILDNAGHVVTNAHVVDDASTVRVTLSDEREFDADVKGRDERLDLAVLQLRGAHDLPRVPLGQSERLRVGETILAIGNPFGLGNTVTTGIVSAKGRELGAGPYDDFIQTDASINPGNSGGPLFNLKGEVVGISTAIVPAGQGIGFAIPIDALKEVLPQLLEKGSVSRGRLGVSVQSMNATLAKAYGMPKPNGALVDDIEPGSPAQKAGIKPGEVIVSVDQSALNHAHDLPRVIARRSPGTRVALKVIASNTTTRTVDVLLDELRDEPQEASKEKGATKRPVAVPGKYHDFGLDIGDSARAGVVIRSVDPNSSAADALEPGDVLLEVNGAPVTSAADAMAHLREAKGERPPILKMQRNGQPFYVAVERK
jgi:serine protease Do